MEKLRCLPKATQAVPKQFPRHGALRNVVSPFNILGTSVNPGTFMRIQTLLLRLCTVYHAHGATQGPESRSPSSGAVPLPADS